MDPLPALQLGATDRTELAAEREEQQRVDTGGSARPRSARTSDAVVSTLSVKSSRISAVTSSMGSKRGSIQARPRTPAGSSVGEQQRGGRQQGLNVVLCWPEREWLTRVTDACWPFDPGVADVVTPS